ncbi:MarR family winged helix-turn-helix transcriptional regulator [Aquibium microcysteis]|uniref:MarR family winged helix-turn-helix transcriptional regulator n=1 Tax=Aquibium microcysteis TaxID=675281 RepID=UPI00165D0AD1|nr:MarR family winged helix-turn-helix transcriptional regulator [Aquibium microcysteis]
MTTRETRTGRAGKGIDALAKTSGRLEVPPMATIIGYKLRRAQLYVFQDFIETFARMKLRPAEFSVLAIIAETPGLKQSEIAEMLGVKRANFVALMDNLEKRGLAERRKAQTDRRSHSVHLTDEGARFVRRMTAMWAEHENRLIERLGGAAERDRLIELLDRLLSPPTGEAPLPET